MDPLSDVMSLLKPRSYLSAGIDAGGAWSIQFPEQGGFIKCYAVIRGQCWLSVEGIEDAVRLDEGDCFVLANVDSFRLSSDVNLTPVDAETIFRPTAMGRVITVNEGGEFFLIGSRFAVSGVGAATLLGMLPRIVHIGGESDQAALRWSIERMMQELSEPQPGGILIAQQLAHMMLVQALRLQLAGSAGAGVGWFCALADAQISAAIGAMHDAPAQRWTLQLLAERACMSRSAFAQKFKATVGSAPLEYLTRWRMLLAADKLTNSGESIGTVSRSLGYQSESAFGTAFKRVMGCSPRQYSRASASLRS